MKIDAVFQGGGVKAIGLVGAINRLEKENISWQRLAGTSAGAIIASLLAVGYTGDQLSDIIQSLDYKKFKGKKGIQKVPIVGQAIGIFLSKGLYDTNGIEQFLRDLYEKKDKTKFKHISYNGRSRLKIIASDVTNNRMLILPEDIAYYGIDPMELDIVTAVVMSISIPFYFAPTTLKHDNRKAFIVDGGLISNFPIWIFDVKGIPRWPTIGFKFEEEIDKNFNCKMCKNGFLSYVKDIIDASLDCYDERFIRDEDKIRTISIPTLGVKATNFNLVQSKKDDLFKAGYDKCNEFLESWDFKDYINQYRV